MNEAMKSLYSAMEALAMAEEILIKNFEDVFHGSNLRDLVTRIQFSKNILVKNEKKIWLRTKKGMEMLSEFEKASKALLEILKTSNDFVEVEKSVLAIETYGVKLEEEIRRRNMVVT